MSGRTKTAFDRAAAAPPPPAQVLPAPPAAPATRKYTVRLDAADADRFDELVLLARRRSGRRVEKSDLIRGLIRTATTYPELLDRLT
jgi:3-oxoacyl-ACP reductase-like protein